MRLIKPNNLLKCSTRFLSVNKRIKQSYIEMTGDRRMREDNIPQDTDVLIIGGGLIGWASAYWIRTISKFKVTLVEMDPSYSKSPSYRGIGAIRQQFTLPENIQMSLFGSSFLREISRHLETSYQKNITVDFNPCGHLLIADKNLAKQFKESFHIQKALGCAVELLNPDQLVKRWPWLNVENVELASHGLENEGWFNPALLLQAFRSKSHELGVNYVTGQLTEFHFSDYVSMIGLDSHPERPIFATKPLRKATIQSLNGEESRITFHYVINAAGSWAKEVAFLGGIGTNDLPVALPVERAIQHCFLIRPSQPVNFDVTYCPGLDSPFLIDSSGINMQRVGLSGDFIVYYALTPADILDFNKPDISHDQLWLQNCSHEFVEEFYTSTIKHRIVNRIPGLKDANVVNAWSSFDDINIFDGSPVVGPHPVQRQMLFACGSSGVGAQHSIAIGRAIAEYCCYKAYRSIDLSCFAFDRFYVEEPVLELNNLCT